MSEAMTRAYAASAEALRQNLLAYAADLLQLEDGIERVFDVEADDPHPYCVRIDPGIGDSFPLIDVSMREWRRRGPGSTIEVMTRAIGRLAFARVWRRHGTVAPPAGLLMTNGLGKALIERSGVDPQAFVDAAWSTVMIGDKYSDTADWMSAGIPPALMARSPSVSRPVKPIPAGIPWTSGYSGADTVFVETVSLDERLTLHWRPQDGWRCEVRIPAGLPMTLATAAPGRPLRTVVSHPLLDRYDLLINSVAFHQRSIRLFLQGDARLWRRERFKGGNEVRRELNEEIRSLRPGRRHLEQLATRSLTIPGRKGDVEVAWDDFSFDDDLVDFGAPSATQTDEIEGIKARRARELATYKDTDPIIRFDEDDPASYE